MDNDKMVEILLKRMDNLSRYQALMERNLDINNEILAATIKNLRVGVGILGLLGAVSGVLYLSHELKQDKKLENLHKSDSKTCSKMCILHKSEMENEDIFDVDDLK